MSTPYTPTRIDLENVRLRAENDRLHLQAEQAQEWRRKWEYESANRLQAQDRLNRAMRVLAGLSWAFPQMRRLIEQARKDVWGED